MVQGGRENGQMEMGPSLRFSSCIFHSSPSTRHLPACAPHFPSSSTLSSPPPPSTCSLIVAPPHPDGTEMPVCVMQMCSRQGQESLHPGSGASANTVPVTLNHLVYTLYFIYCCSPSWLVCNSPEQTAIELIERCLPLPPKNWD